MIQSISACTTCDWQLCDRNDDDMINLWRWPYYMVGSRIRIMCPHDERILSSAPIMLIYCQSKVTVRNRGKFCEETGCEVAMKSQLSTMMKTEQIAFVWLLSRPVFSAILDSWRPAVFCRVSSLFPMMMTHNNRSWSSNRLMCLYGWFVSWSMRRCFPGSAGSEVEDRRVLLLDKFLLAGKKCSDSTCVTISSDPVRVSVTLTIFVMHQTVLSL